MKPDETERDSKRQYGKMWDDMGRCKKMWDDKKQHGTSVKSPMVFWAVKTRTTRFQTTTLQTQDFKQQPDNKRS